MKDCYKPSFKATLLINIPSEVMTILVAEFRHKKTGQAKSIVTENKVSEQEGKKPPCLF